VLLNVLMDSRTGLGRFRGARRDRFEVETRYGDWSRGPLTTDSDNIVVVATAKEPHAR
jgi:hypothetical protein